MNKIAIFGVPRSGTSWLCQIFNSHPDVVLRFQPLFSYGHKGRLTADSTAGNIRKFFDEILDTQDSFAMMSSEMQKNYPSFKKSASPTHIAFKETRYIHIIENILSQCSEIKIIGIVRDPLAVLASWVSAPREYNSEWDIRLEWREALGKNENRPEEFYGFNKWKEVAEQFLYFERRYPEQFILVKYGDLNKAPVDVATRMFTFCDLEVCDQVREFIVESKSRHDPDPYSVYRSNADDRNWDGILPDQVVQQVMLELKNTPLDVFLQDVMNA
jgi:hypothetical protein